MRVAARRRRSRPARIPASESLSLADVNRLANARWVRWQDVQPPRRFRAPSISRPRRGGQRLGRSVYRDWDTFRKHLVALHYDELAQWTHDAGIPKERIFTAQGFVAPEGDRGTVRGSRRPARARTTIPAGSRSRVRSRARGISVRSSMDLPRRTGSAWTPARLVRNVRADGSRLGGGRVEPGRPQASRAVSGVRAGLSRVPGSVQLRRAAGFADGLERFQRHFRRPARLRLVHVVAQHAGGRSDARSPGLACSASGRLSTVDVRIGAACRRRWMDGGSQDRCARNRAD